MDSGADLDRTNVPIHQGQWIRQKETPLVTNANLRRGFERRLLCRKYLLQAGADPTIGIFYLDDPEGNKFTIYDDLHGSSEEEYSAVSS